MARNRSNKLIDHEEATPEEATYQSRLRHAVFDGVSEKDVSEVVKKIVERAKKGDKVAIKMMFDYVLGGTIRSQSIEQHNHYHTRSDDMDEPLLGRPGSPERIEQLRRRADAKLGVFEDRETA